MSNNDKNDSNDLLAHEKAISELYQNNKQHHTEGPSAQIDAKIMALAEQQLLDNPSALIKDPLPEQQTTGIQKTPSRDKTSWQWPFSLVASVGLLSILFITQREYFINPTHVVSNDVDLLNEPVIQQTPDMNMLEPETKESLVRPSFQAMDQGQPRPRLPIQHSRRLCADWRHGETWIASEELALASKQRQHIEQQTLDMLRQLEG